MAEASSPLKNLLKINLLVHPADQLKLHVRLFKWILSSGRYIVVIVELIVISAFVYRYKLDADLVGLQEQIKEQSEYVKSLKNDEKIIRSTQFQLSSIHKVKGANANLPQVLSLIAAKTPKGITLTTINIDQSTLTLSGVTPSNLELSAFLKALETETKFSDMKLTNITYDTQTTFTIAGGIK